MADNLMETIDRWFIETFHREPIAQNTEHLNYVRRAVDELKKRLSGPQAASPFKPQKPGDI